MILFIFFLNEWWRKKIVDNEVQAMLTMHYLLVAERGFQEKGAKDKDKDGVYEFGKLADLYSSDLITEPISSGKFRGYHYAIHVKGNADKAATMWWACAYPTKYKWTGMRTFYISENGILRGKVLEGKQLLIQDEALKLNFIEKWPLLRKNCYIYKKVFELDYASEIDLYNVSSKENILDIVFTCHLPAYRAELE